MATAWNGADPAEFAGDTDDYELGVAYRANADITITHLRIHPGAGEESIANRRGRVWSSVGAQQAIVTLPEDMADGWTLHALDMPLPMPSGTTFVFSYSTGGRYSTLSGALDDDVVSADGNVTALAAANAPGGHNGRFDLTPGTFPNAGAGTHPFYGVDFQYTVGIGGNTAPRITDTSAIANGLQVTAAAVVEDDESLTGLTLRIEWGDGNADTVTYPDLDAIHTYATGGTWPLLFRATDSSGATDYAADYVITTAPDGTLFTLDILGLQGAICAAMQRTGYLKTVGGHEPREAPTKDPHGAVWLSGPIRPARVSGLASVATCVTWLVRVYLPADSKPYDEIDQELYRITDALMALFFGEFTLGGRVRNVDIFGAHSPGFSAEPGYQRIGSTTFRVMTITLPLIVNDQFEEVP